MGVHEAKIIPINAKMAEAAANNFIRRISILLHDDTALFFPRKQLQRTHNVVYQFRILRVHTQIKIIYIRF